MTRTRRTAGSSRQTGRTVAEGIRSVGIEEELLVVDPCTRTAVPGSATVLRALAQETPTGRDD